jgi:beta-glucosidase
VAALRKRGLEPVVTLHHFTNPAWFTLRGGWTSADSVGFFRRYVEAVSARLAEQVRYWLTINEPTIYVSRAFLKGDWPPCQPGSWVRAAQALRNLCRAHTTAYVTIHKCRSDAMVGFAHSAPYVVAHDPRRRLDRYAAHLRDFVLNGLCFRLLGRVPRRVLDYIGINYYVRQVVRWHPWGMAALFGVEHKASGPMERRQFNSLGWEVYPDGLRQVIKKFAAYDVPLMITENGVATSDEALRKDFIAAHVRALALAMQDGVRVLGHLYWTPFDNYEWSEGTTAHFGLAAISLPDQTRTARPAVAAFERICRSNEISIDEPTT